MLKFDIHGINYRHSTGMEIQKDAKIINFGNNNVIEVDNNMVTTDVRINRVCIDKIDGADVNLSMNISILDTHPMHVTNHQSAPRGLVYNILSEELDFLVSNFDFTEWDDAIALRNVIDFVKNRIMNRIKLNTDIVNKYNKEQLAKYKGAIVR